MVNKKNPEELTEPKTLSLNITMEIFGSLSAGYSDMVNEGKGRIFRRKDGKYLLYIPKDLAEDSMFPFKADPWVRVKVSFKVGNKKLTIEKWREKTDA